MIENYLNIPADKLLEAAGQTIYMLGISLFFGTLIGIPLGLLLVLTRKNGVKANHTIHFLVSGLVNIVRSVPFVILLVFIAPLTKVLVGTRIGTKAAIVPLVFYIAPYLARLIESSILEVQPGILEAAKAMGANTLEIIRYFLLPEAKASLVLALTTGTIGLLGATAMAGTIGGGGVGDLALTYGYQRFNNTLMFVTVIILIIYGKAAGPYTVLFEDAIIPILKKEGYQFKCIEFSDLLQNDTALNEGEIDVNVEQHTAYMKNFNESQDGDLVALTAIPTVPAGIFSNTHKSLEEIKKGAKIAVPNDASNTSRAYVLLQKAKYITLDPDVDISSVTKDDIIKNPYEIEFTEMDSTMIPQALDEFDYAVITGSIVYNAGIDASSALLQEDVLEHLLLQVVVKEKNKDTKWAKAIVEAYRSKEFKEYLDKNNNGLWYVPSYN